MEYRILGPLEVFDAGIPLAVGGPRHRRLLAVLLSTRARRSPPNA